MPVLGIVDIAGRRSQDGHLLLVKHHGQVVGDLSPGGKYHPFGCFKFHNIHDPFIGELVKIEPVAYVVIGGNRFGIIIDHYGSPAFPADRQQGLYPAPVEFHGASNAVSPRAQDYYGASVLLIINVVFPAPVGQVQVIGPGRIFGCQGIYLLDNRSDTQRFP